jgi:hypothetical protein
MSDSQIYLVGQTHSSEPHARLIEDFVREEEPDCILLELLDDYRHNDITDEIIFEGNHYNFSRVEEYLKNSFKEVPELFYSSDQKLLEKELDSGGEGVTPTSEEELYETPWMDMDSGYLEHLIEDIERQIQHEREEFDKWSSEDVEPAKYDSKISELQKIANNYRENLESKRSSQSTQEERVKAAVYDLHKKDKRTELKGCDLDKEDEFAGMSREEIKQKALSEEFNQRRRTRQTAEICDAAQEYNGLIVASIGRNHYDPVKRNLEERGLSVEGVKLDKNSDSDEYGKEALDRL